jgi:aerobic-type carbon monoxide dehydrogenase small subunit (CoxS/CutS family)
VNLEFTLNGRRTSLDVPPHWTLLRMLRDAAGQTDVKHGCGEGVCGACAALVDGIAVNACSVLAPQVEGASVETTAGLARDGELHPLQAEMVSRGAVQCGFCTPGIVISALEAVRIGAVGSEEEIRHSLAGNLCRCTGYGKIVASVVAYRDRAAEEPATEPVGARVGVEEERSELGGEGAAPAPGVGPGP